MPSLLSDSPTPNGSPLNASISPPLVNEYDTDPATASNDHSAGDLTIDDDDLGPVPVIGPDGSIIYQSSTSWESLVEAGLNEYDDDELMPEGGWPEDHMEW